MRLRDVLKIQMFSHLLYLSCARLIFFTWVLPVFILGCGGINPAQEVKILFTHDLHSNLEEYAMPSGQGGASLIGGYARLYSAIEKERYGKKWNTLLLDAGDFSMGTLFHVIRSKYSTELVTMGLMGYDVTTFGNHEFDFGPEPLAQALLAAKNTHQVRTPEIVASNTVVDPGSSALAGFYRAYNDYPVLPYTLIRRSGLKIGVFALMGKDAAGYAQEAKPIIFTDPKEAALRTVKILRTKERADLVICLSHSGTWANRDISEDHILARDVPGIDLIISGHTHTVLDPYIRVGNTYIVSSGAYGRYLGSVTLARDPGGFRVSDYRVIPMDSKISADAKTSGFIKSFERYIEEEYLKTFGYHYGQILAHSPVSMNNPDWDKGYDRRQFITSGLGDLVGDALCYAVKKAEGKDYQDISLVIEGFGQIRVPLAKGRLSVNDVFRLMALGIGPDEKAGCGLAAFWLTGSEIKKVFELETTLAPIKYDLRLQVTGMRFFYDPDGEPFRRVKKAEVYSGQGKFKPLEDDRLYRVCTSWKTLQMRKSLEELSRGNIAFIPKDENGDPVADLRSTLIFLDKDRQIELKEWLAVAMYLESFPVGDNGLPEVPEKYQYPVENII